MHQCWNKYHTDVSFDSQGLSVIPFHFLKSIDLTPNEAVLEYHSTSIALLKTINWIPFHTNVSFDFQVIPISIWTSYQWFLLKFSIRIQLMPMYSLIANWIFWIDSVFFSFDLIDTIVSFNSQLNWKTYNRNCYTNVFFDSLFNWQR